MQKRILRPYKKGVLKVSDVHSLYYELCGDPSGTPAVFLHGGPGGGISKSSRRWFPQSANALLYDQRGAGKSRPHASIVDNTTGHLVEDLRRLLDHVGMKQVIIFGGSWGSTLALCFAIKYPERVKALLLRGVFLGMRSEIDYLYSGAPYAHHPAEVDRFLSYLPARARKSPITSYLKLLCSKKLHVRKKAAFEWALYERSLCSVHADAAKLSREMRDADNLPIARLEAHYMAHDCFLPPGYILRNARRLTGIPVTIVHGRYDMVCPFSSAYALKGRLPKARLRIVQAAGHSANDLSKELHKELARLLRAVRRSR